MSKRNNTGIPLFLILLISYHRLLLQQILSSSSSSDSITVFASATKFQNQLPTFRKIKTNNSMAPQSTIADNVTSSSSVLGELKETIQTQAREIERLREELKGITTRKAAAVATSVSHGGHGGGAAGEPSEEDVARYLRQPFYEISAHRVGWLGLFLSSLSMTALIMNVFEETLEKHIELAYFVPLLAGHGGNTGGQTVGTVLSALSAGTVKPSDAPRVVLKEAMAGIMSGTILGSIVSPIAYKVLGVSFHVAVVLFFTLPLVSMVASTLGSLIPFACVGLGLEPSVIAAPAMTSIVDVTGLMSYFLIANHIFKLYGLEL
jgi:cation transporter-like permease